MDGKVFVATYSDGSTKVLGDYCSLGGEPFVEGKWVEFDDAVVRNSTWEAWEAEEIVEL